MKIRFDGRDQPQVTMHQTEEGCFLRFSWERIPSMWLNVDLLYTEGDDCDFEINASNVTEADASDLDLPT